MLQHTSDAGTADVPAPSNAAPSNLEDFLALVVHEVNTPLSIVDMASEAALDGYEDLDPDELRELLEVINRNVELAMLLMKRMGLAREIEEGVVELSRESIDLAELIRQSVGDLASAVLSEHSVELDLPETYEVGADATAIREIVFNLLANASKYSAPAAPIEIALHDDDGRVVVAIRNHGRGVTPGDTEAIFDKYFQGESGSSGVGLGLFISRGLARAHGGDITLRPATDVGSEFRLELPNPAGRSS